MKHRSIESWLERFAVGRSFGLCSADEGGGGDDGSGGGGDPAGAGGGDSGGDGDGGGGLLAGAKGEEGGGDDGGGGGATNTFAFGEETIEVPEQFWDKDKGEVNVGAALKSAVDSRATVTTLQNEIKDLKAAGGEKPVGVPEKAEGYLTPEALEAGTLKSPEGVTKLADIAADDPGLVAFLDIALEAGLTPKQFNTIIEKTMLVADGMTAAPFDEAAEAEKFGTNAKGVAQANKTWVDNLHKTGVISEAEHLHVLNMGKDAVGLSVVNKLRMQGGGKAIPVTPGGVAGELPSKEEWYASKPDARLEPDKYGKWIKDGEAIFGTGPAGSSESGLGVPASRGGHRAARDQKKA